MKQLNEKVAIVTGAGQGIGEGIALCLAKRGVKVVCTVIRFFFLSFNSKMARTPVLAIFRVIKLNIILYIILFLSNFQFKLLNLFLTGYTFDYSSK